MYDDKPLNYNDNTWKLRSTSNTCMMINRYISDDNCYTNADNRYMYDDNQYMYDDKPLHL